MFDLRHALRLLKKDPAFTAVALLTLALGIGANVAIFSIVNAVLLRPLPYEEPGGIMQIGERAPFPGSGPRAPIMTNHTYEAWRDEGQTLAKIAAYTDRSYTLTGSQEAVRLQGAAVSASLFELLRAAAIAGRPFDAANERFGANRVAVLGESLWERSFGRDPDIVGRSVTLDGEPHEVVGIMPASFRFPSPEAEIWTPFVLRPLPADRSDARIVLAFSALARLKTGVTPAQAEAEGTAIIRQLQEERAWLRGPGEQAQPAVTVTPLQESMVAEFRPAMLVLWAAVAFVLIVACANLANLLLARGAARQRELAIRSAIGAARVRLVRQLLAETLLLGLAGGVAGVGAAYWLHALLLSVVPPEIPRVEEAALDTTVLAFALALSLVTGLLVGVMPAVHGSRLNPSRSLNESGGRQMAGAGILGARARNVLAVIEVALAVVLLVGAGLLVKSFVRLIDVDPGYDTANVLTMRLNLPSMQRGFAAPPSPEEGRKAQAARLPVFDELVSRTTSLPGVEAAGLVSFLPLSPGEARIMFGIDGRPEETDPATRPTARPQIVTPGYFAAAGLRLVEGRFLSDDDRSTSPPVAVVNQAFARAYFPGERVVGARLRLGPSGASVFEIVGVVGDVRHQGLTSEPQPEFYVPVHQATAFPFLGPRPYLVVKTTGDPVAMLPTLRQTVRDVDPSIPLDDVMTMEGRLSASVAQPRFYAVLLGIFALLTALLAATGLYGVLAHMVSERRREIGVRLALGAADRQLVGMVLRHGATLIAAGVVLGLAAAFGVSRALATLLFGVTPTDPGIYVMVPLLLLAVGLAACYVPARRATRVDPMEALRAE